MTDQDSCSSVLNVHGIHIAKLAKSRWKAWAKIDNEVDLDRWATFSLIESAIQPDISTNVFYHFSISKIFYSIHLGITIIKSMASQSMIKSVL